MMDHRLKLVMVRDGEPWAWTRMAAAAFSVTTALADLMFINHSNSQYIVSACLYMGSRTLSPQLACDLVCAEILPIYAGDERPRWSPADNGPDRLLSFRPARDHCYIFTRPGVLPRRSGEYGVHSTR